MHCLVSLGISYLFIMPLFKECTNCVGPRILQLLSVFVSSILRTERACYSVWKYNMEMKYGWSLVSIISITCISLYFLRHEKDENFIIIFHPSVSNIHKWETSGNISSDARPRSSLPIKSTLLPCSRLATFSSATARATASAHHRRPLPAALIGDKRQQRRRCGA